MNIPMYSPVGEHTQLTGLSTTKPVDIPATANAVILQAISQNVRVKMKGTATSGQGFRITAGNDAQLFPIGSGTLSVQEEAASATLEYQFVRVHGLGV